MPRALNLSKSYLIFGVNHHQEKHRGLWENFGKILQTKFILTGVLSFLLIFIYIFQINLTVKRNYEIRNLESQILNLQIENQKLKVEALSLENPQIIRERARYLGMEEVGTVSYIKVFSPTFAKK